MGEKRLPKKRKQSYKKASFLGCIYNKGNRIIKALFSARHDVMKQCCNPWAFLVYHNDKIVGFYWGIRNDYKKELYVILAGVDEEYEWYSPAISQFYLFLQEYCNSERDDISVFDFTRGGEKYKTDIGCADKPTSGIVFSLK